MNYDLTQLQAEEPIQDPEGLVLALSSSMPHSRENIIPLVDSSQIIITDQSSREKATELATLLQKTRTENEAWRKKTTEPFLKIQRLLKERVDAVLEGVHEAEKELRQRISLYDENEIKKEAELIAQLDQRYNDRCNHLSNKLGMVMDATTIPALWVLPGTDVTVSDAMLRTASRESLVELLETKVVPAYNVLQKQKAANEKVVQEEELRYKRLILERSGAQKNEFGWWMLNKHGIHDKNLESTPVKDVFDFVKNGNSNELEIMHAIRQAEQETKNQDPVQKDIALLHVSFNSMSEIMSYIKNMSSKGIDKIQKSLLKELEKTSGKMSAAILELDKNKPNTEQ